MDTLNWLMENGELIMKTCLISWFIVEHPFFSVMAEIINDTINKKKNELITYIITQPFNCVKCASLYVGIIYVVIFGGPWWAPIISSILMDQWDKKMNVMHI